MKWWPRGRNGSSRPRARRTPARAPAPAPIWPRGITARGNWRWRSTRRAARSPIDPGFADAYGLLGLIYMDMNERGDAEENFQKALRLDPAGSELANNYGWFLCQTGRERESIQYFDRALRDPLYTTPARAGQNAGSCLHQGEGLRRRRALPASIVRAGRVEPGDEVPAGAHVPGDRPGRPRHVLLQPAGPFGRVDARDALARLAHRPRQWATCAPRASWPTNCGSASRVRPRWRRSHGVTSMTDDEVARGHRAGGRRRARLVRRAARGRARKGAAQRRRHGRAAAPAREPGARDRRARTSRSCRRRPTCAASFAAMRARWDWIPLRSSTT